LVFVSIGNGAAQPVETITVTGNTDKPPLPPVSRGALTALNKGVEAANKKKYKKALKEFDKACKGNAPDGCFNLLRLLGSDDYGLKDFPRALEAAKRACDLRVIEGCVTYGGAHKFGFMGVGIDHATGEKYLSIACDDGYGVPDACSEVAHYVLGDSNRLNELPALYKVMEEACDNDESEQSNACIMFAAMLAHGIGGEQDEEEALSMYDDFCDLGNSYACYRAGILTHKLARANNKEEQAKARDFLDKACQMDEASACAARLELGFSVNYTKKLWHIQEGDNAKIVAAANKGCELEHPDACFIKGAMLRFGEGVTRDHRKANQNIEKACQDGHYQACIELMLQKELGIGTDIDPAGAANLLDKVCFGNQQTYLGSYCQSLPFFRLEYSEDDRMFTTLAEHSKSQQKGLCNQGNLNACILNALSATNDEERDNFFITFLEQASKHCGPYNSMTWHCSLAIGSNRESDELELSETTLNNLALISEQYPKTIRQACRSNDYDACIAYLA
ncbi:MAG: tetratricopeptide repeat protein, partial [Bacteroidota bacterium]